MNIIVIGGGKVGETLCRDLSTEGNDVILIEKDYKKLEHIIQESDITGVVGNGATMDILMEAETEKADVFISVTDKDEINIISCILARKIGAKYTIARVRNPEYFTHMNFVRDELGIDIMINPELEASKEIVNTLRYSEALSVEAFMGDRVHMVEFEVHQSDVFEGKALKDLDTKGDRVLVCIVKRGDEAIIPDGNFVIKEGDFIYVTGTTEVLAKLNRKFFGTAKTRSVLILGGGRITYYLLERLTRKNIDVVVFERDEERARELSQDFPSATILNRDGTEQEALVEEGIGRHDAFIALTGIDEENIIASLFAKTMGVPKAITKVSRQSLMPMFERLGLESFVSPKQTVADIIVRFVRSIGNVIGSKVLTLHRLMDNTVEALEFNISPDSIALGVKLKELPLQKGVLIACILRDGRLIFPGGEDALRAGDRVMVVTTAVGLEDLDDVIDAGDIE